MRGSRKEEGLFLVGFVDSANHAVDGAHHRQYFGWQALFGEDMTGRLRIE